MFYSLLVCNSMNGNCVTYTIQQKTKQRTSFIVHNLKRVCVFVVLSLIALGDFGTGVSNITAYEIAGDVTLFVHLLLI